MNKLPDKPSELLMVAMVLKKEDCFLDSVGNILLPNDLVRMKHFRTNGKKYYMYKTVQKYAVSKPNNEGLRVRYIYFSHFDGEGGFYVREDEQDQLKDMVVVQRGSFYNNPKVDELKRSREIRD